MSGNSQIKVTRADGSVEVLTADGKRRRASIPSSVRDAVVLRDGGICRYCGHKARPIHLDHVIPHSKGGADTVGNLVVSCTLCNGRKKDQVWTPKPPRWLSKYPKRQSKAQRIEGYKAKAERKRAKRAAEMIADREALFVDNRVADEIRREASP